MKTLGALAPLLAGPVTHLCRLVKITALSGTVYAMTDLDTSITVDGVLYRADIGVDLSNAAAQDGTSQSSLDITVILRDIDPASGVSMSRATLAAGLLDDAACVISVCDWQALVASPYYAGKVRHITYADNLSATLEIVNALDSNLQLASDVYTYTCRVDLGSPKCGVPIAATAKNFTISAVTDRQVFVTDLSDDDDYWLNGLVKFLTGANAGRSVEVAGYARVNGAIVLKLPAAFAIAVGDTGTIYRGCNKTPQDCCDKWNNMPNYRGEPTGIPKATTSTVLGGGSPTSGNPPTTVAPPPTLTATPDEIAVLRKIARGGYGLKAMPGYQPALAAGLFNEADGTYAASLTTTGQQQLSLAGG